LFEDRVMKADYLRIGDGCSVGNMTVVLYGTEMQSRSSLAPLSVLMKGEVLPVLSRWAGIPTKPVDTMPPAEVVAQSIMSPGIVGPSGDGGESLVPPPKDETRSRGRFDRSRSGNSKPVGAR
jgi:hypothetical protein